AAPQLAGPRVLYVFGNGQSPAAALGGALPCPVESVSPLIISDSVAPRADEQGPLAGAVGLLQRWAVARRLPANLGVPKRARAVASPARRRTLFYGVLGALVLTCAIGAMYYTLSAKRAQILKINAEKNKLESELKTFAQDRVDLDALADWE